MSLYRCRYEIGDGSYTYDPTTDIQVALDQMASHPIAQVVVVERRDGRSWDFVVAGIWRKKVRADYGTVPEALRVPADVAPAGMDRGLEHPQQVDRG